MAVEGIDERIKKVADWCLKNKISVIPIGEDKKPAVKWSQYIDEPMTEWDYPGCNIAIITGETNGIVVVDCDTAESAAWWWKNRPKTPLMTKTKRGVHFYYRHPGQYVKSDAHIKIEDGIEHDLRGDRAYVLLPPSYRSGHQYQFIMNDDNPRASWQDPLRLPLFQMEWRPDRVKEDFDTKEINDIQKYISKIFANEGQGGDKITYKVCCILQENNISEADAMAILLQWNMTNANPPWDVYSLRRKLRTCYS